ncbi:MAG: hypothetical protein ACK50L_02810, partial [Bacteroidota bacterium]
AFTFFVNKGLLPFGILKADVKGSLAFKEMLIVKISISHRWLNLEVNWFIKQAFVFVIKFEFFMVVLFPNLKVFIINQ